MKLILFFILFSINCFGSQIVEQFDHEFHKLKVFDPQKIDCTHCHTFNQNQSQQLITLNSSKSIFNKSLKQICHECHQSPETKYTNAPKECFFCHKNNDGLNKIKPINHKNVSWKNTHSMVAKVQGDQCFQCHQESSCTKCHSQRNDIQMNNHNRNFRFYHSIQARLQPQKCDTCHSTNFCTSCHQGKPMR